MVAAIVAGVFLLFHRLAWNGGTWDERVDFRIALDFAQTGGILTNRSDPTQGRLPHMVAAVSLLLFGETFWAFKLPFALAGLGVGALLYAFVSRRYDAKTALYCLAFYATNPWMLASSRTGGTGGDILLVMTTFAFFWAAIGLMENRDPSRRRLRQACGFGFLTGIAVGAKLSSIVLLPLGLAVIVLTRRSMRHVVAFAALASLFAVATHPLLVIDRERLAEEFTATVNAGPNPFATLVPQESAASSHRPAAVVPVSLEPTPKLRYLWFLLVGKLTLPFLVVVCFGMAVGVRECLRSRRIDVAFWGAAAVVLMMCGLLVWKYKQNANYFLPLVLPAITLAALPLARALGSAATWLRLAGSLGWLALVAYQLWLSVGLAPDYLQAGRRMGPEAQGLMAGPAVNHCQGTPLLVERLNRLRQTEEFADVPVFKVCNSNIGMNLMFGPVKPAGYRLVMYRSKTPPERPHLLVVSEVLHYFGFGEEIHAQRIRELEQVTRGCALIDDQPSGGRFKIYRCP